jgi:hypothetical protein
MQRRQRSLLAMQACCWAAAQAPSTAAPLAASLAAVAAAVAVVVWVLVVLLCRLAMMPGRCTMVELVDPPCAGCSDSCNTPHCQPSTRKQRVRVVEMFVCVCTRTAVECGLVWGCFVQPVLHGHCSLWWVTCRIGSVHIVASAAVLSSTVAQDGFLQ